MPLRPASEWGRREEGRTGHPEETRAELKFSKIGLTRVAAGQGDWEKS